MTNHNRQIIRARLTLWPGEQYACAWPMDPDEEERFWLLGHDGQIAATFWRYRVGMFRR
jgi:hypothetical protein